MQLQDAPFQILGQRRLDAIVELHEAVVLVVDDRLELVFSPIYLGAKRGGGVLKHMTQVVELEGHPVDHFFDSFQSLIIERRLRASWQELAPARL